jgi:hypothetical protein
MAKAITKNKSRYIVKKTDAENDLHQFFYDLMALLYLYTFHW